MTRIYLTIGPVPEAHTVRIGSYLGKHVLHARTHYREIELVAAGWNDDDSAKWEQGRVDEVAVPMPEDATVLIEGAFRWSDFAREWPDVAACCIPHEWDVQQVPVDDLGFSPSARIGEPRDHSLDAEYDRLQREAHEMGLPSTYDTEARVG